jgi:hypothetical protein
MKKIILLLFICFSAASCRTTNMLHPIKIIQTTYGVDGMTWEDDHFRFDFTLNDTYWHVSILNKTQDRAVCLWDRSVYSARYTNETIGTTKKIPAFNRTSILPETGISKIMFSNVRKYIYAPKEIYYVSPKEVMLVIPVEVKDVTKEYEFLFTISEDKENRYTDEVYNR